MVLGSLDSSPLSAENLSDHSSQSAAATQWAKKAWTYLLRCADNTFYCGSTTDLERRIAEHNAPPTNILHKGAKYTRGRQPLTLLWSEEQLSLGAALKREYQIKQMNRVQKEALLGE